MKNTLYSILGAAPESWIQGALGKKCLLPYYHMVSDEDVPHVSSLYAYRNVARFTEDLELLARGRKALSLDEFLSATREGGEPPENSFLLTFDDGFREMHDIVAPILTAKGIPAVFFVMSDMLDNEALCFQQKISLLIDHSRRHHLEAHTRAEVSSLLRARGITQRELSTAIKSVPWSERGVLDDVARVFSVDFSTCLREVRPYLTSGQVTALIAQGFAIGAHSLDHPRYCDIPLAEQLRQTRNSMQFLVERFPIKNRVFAFPHTDSRVSMKFFQLLIGEGTVEATFGTSGPRTDTAPSSFQRFSMEKPDLTGKTLLARHAFRRCKCRLSGSTKIYRPL